MPEASKILRFEYYAPKGNSEREIEPYYLVFKWSSWYVYGYCLLRNDFRLFKLNRMDGAAETESDFVCRDAPVPDLSNEAIFPGEIQVSALFAPEMKWRLVEDFGPDCYTEADDGRLLFSAGYTDLDNLVTWLMTFGAKAEVLGEHYLFCVFQAIVGFIQLIIKLLLEIDVFRIERGIRQKEVCGSCIILIITLNIGIVFGEDTALDDRLCFLIAFADLRRNLRNGFLRKFAA